MAPQETFIKNVARQCRTVVEGIEKGETGKTHTVSTSIPQTPELLAIEVVREINEKYKLRECPIYAPPTRTIKMQQKPRGEREEREATLPTGLIIAVEGLDGAGVTTISQLLAHALRGIIVNARPIYLKEPTDSPIGTLIRGILRGYIKRIERSETLLHLFIADRLHHLYEYEVVPGVRGALSLLDKAYILVFDRYKYSNAVYQAAGFGANDPTAYTMEEILALNELAPPPHILVYLDVEPSEALRRVAASRRYIEIPETRETLERIRLGFQRLIEMLREEPEWPVTLLAEEKPKWFAKLEQILNVNPLCVYPPAAFRAPYIVTVDANKPLEEVAHMVIREVVRAAEELKLIHRL